MKLKFLVLPTLVLSTTLAMGVAEAHSPHGSGSGGLASWYGPGFWGHRTANGERLNAGSFTAAHRFFPFGTRVLVTSRRTGRSVVVRINDRGPFARGRIIDLSSASARAIGMSGTESVTLARL